MNKKRVLFASDGHGGSNVGMTPPKWQVKPEAQPKLAKIQSELWNWYSKEIKKLGAIDLLVYNGDAIDGKGKRSGGTEQLTTDRTKQCDIAAFVINYVEAKQVLMTYGTGYHVGIDEDWEDIVASKVKNLIKIGSHEWPEINGVIFDVKHKIGASTVPHGRMTALAKARLWNQIWNSAHDSQPDAHVIIRSHVHYHNQCGGDGWLAMTLPALQGYGSKFGSRECQGLVDIGMVVFDIYENGEYKWKPIFARLPQQKAQVLHI